GPTMQTLVQRPAMTRRCFPNALTWAITLASSQVFMEVRSYRTASARASLISGNTGPAKEVDAIVVTIVSTLNPAAALQIRATLLRRLGMSMEWVGNAICDWKSISSRAWSVGVSSDLPAATVAWVMMASGMEVKGDGRAPAVRCKAAAR